MSETLWYIEVVHKDTEEVAVRFGPMSEADMQRSRDVADVLGWHPESYYKTRSVRAEEVKS